MQENEREWPSNQDEVQREDDQEQTQLPSSLLSNVLHRLELSPEQKPSESSLADVLLQLRSDLWQERTQALYALGKMDHAVSLDLFAPFLHDEDETVRATTLYVLGTMSKKIPLHWLVEALQDKNWHVRENAVFALAKQGARVPREVFMTALHDRDGSVREAASFVLQQRSGDEATSALYGQLREETAMQQEFYDPAQSKRKQNGHRPVTTSNAKWSGTLMEYSGNAPRTHVVNEQVQQAYAAGYQAPHSAMAQESVPEGYAEEVKASRYEKVTSYGPHGKSHRRRWIATVIITAILFLGLGRLSTTILPQSISGGGVKNVTSDTAASQSYKSYAEYIDKTQNLHIDPNNNPLVNGTTYGPAMEEALSNAFHLTPQQILDQVKQLGSLDAVAARQGVSSAQLYTVEMNTFNTIINYATTRGDVTLPYGAYLQAQLKSDTVFREKLVLELLTGGKGFG